MDVSLGFSRFMWRRRESRGNECGLWADDFGAWFGIGYICLGWFVGYSFMIWHARVWFGIV